MSEATGASGRLAPDFDFDERRHRVRAVLLAARRIADPEDPLGREARRLLPHFTGLSPQGIELGLCRHLEASATDAEVCALVGATEPGPRVHVVLSANVFVAAARALALALASSPTVRVRASRREPVMADLLVRALREQPSPLDIGKVSHLDVLPSDHVHIYGRAHSIESIARTLPPGARVWAHGPGLGLAVIGEHDEQGAAAEALSHDVAAFDQRGCLSPRIVIWAGATSSTAQSFAETLHLALLARETEVPRGRLDPDEASQALFFIRSAQMTGRCWTSPASVVGLCEDPAALVLPPPGRHVSVVCVPPAAIPAWIPRLAPQVTTLGSLREEVLLRSLAALMPSARLARIGSMQRPPFDGPVDRRTTIGAPLRVHVPQGPIQL